MKKNIDRFRTHEEAENAFLAECWKMPFGSKFVPWAEWDDDMKNRYRLWLFEHDTPAAKIDWTPYPDNGGSSAKDEIPETKTFSNTKTIYWTNPPCFDDNNTNNAIDDYDKVAKEAVDAWFNNLKTQADGGRTRLNKDRFDDFDSAWNCFECECSFNDKNAAEIYFSRWLFYPYVPGAVRIVRESAVVKNLRDRFSKMGYSENLEDENKKLREFIEKMFEEFPMFNFIAENPVHYETRKNGSE